MRRLRLRYVLESQGQTRLCGLLRPVVQANCAGPNHRSKKDPAGILGGQTPVRTLAEDLYSAQNFPRVNANSTDVMQYIDDVFLDHGNRYAREYSTAGCPGENGPPVTAVRRSASDTGALDRQG